MKLTIEDKKTLHDIGIPDSDFQQIERAMTKTDYKYRSRKISREKAIELLGRKNYLSGLSRSAFHWTAARETATGECVYFDSCRLFAE